MSSFNLAQVIPSLDSGGAERGTIDVANYLSSEKIHNTIISSGGKMLKEVNSQYVNHFKTSIDSKNPILFFQLSTQIANYISRNNINIVHVRSRAPAWIISMIRKRKFKTIATFHNVYGGDFAFKKIYNKGLAKMDYLIAISDFVKNHIVDKYNINPEKIKTIYRGIDTDYFTNNISEADVKALKSKFNYLNDSKIILFPGRLTQWKGQLEFLLIAKKLSNKKIIICFAGDDKNISFKTILDKKIQDMNLQETCKIMGNLNMQELKTMYSISDIVLSLPQRPEGFGRTVSESLSMKKMLLAFNYGGAKDQLHNLDNIYKVIPLNYIDLEKKIVKILNLDDESKRNLIIKGREHVKKNFSKKQMVYNYKQFYESKSQ